MILRKKLKFICFCFGFFVLFFALPSTIFADNDEPQTESGINWDSTKPTVSIIDKQDSYKVGDTMKISIVVPIANYLNHVSVFISKPGAGSIPKEELCNEAAKTNDCLMCLKKIFPCKDGNCNFAYDWTIQSAGEHTLIALSMSSAENIACSLGNMLEYTTSVLPTVEGASTSEETATASYSSPPPGVGTTTGGTPADVTTDINTYPAGSTALINYLRDLYDDYLIIIGSALAVIMLIWSGIQYITSAGNPEGIEAAKNRVFYTLSGYALLLLVGVIYKLLIQ